MATPAKNLVAVINAGAAPNGSYGTFNATAYAALAKKLVDGSVPANTVAYIRAAQEASGGWDFNGDPGGNDADVDNDAIAIQALAAAGVAGTDPDLRAGLAFLANHQRSDGAWEAFGSADPNSTSVAIYAVTAAGFNPAKSCWRDVVAPALAGNHTRRRWFGCSRSRTTACRRRPTRAGSTARTTGSA